MSTTTATAKPADVALLYAEQMGWYVLPLYPIRDGKCSCGKPNCDSPGKHPIKSLVPNGVKNASNDSAIIAGWWNKWHDANIGIATGAGSGVIVIDADDYKIGGDALSPICDALGTTMPDTLTAITGGGGRHFVFQRPDRPVGNKGLRHNGQGVRGVDVRGDGGYIVAEPSNHISGRTYTWLDDGPGEVSIAPVPGWLLKLIPLVDEADEPLHQKNGQLPARVSELVSRRETTLFRRWQGDAQSLTDDSKSSIAASITLLLIKHHIPTEDVKAALRYWCNHNGAEQKGNRDDWINQTVDSAYKFAGEHFAVDESTGDANGQPTEVESVRLSEVDPEPITWLWRNRIPVGKTTNITGDPDTGKSFVSLDIAATVTTARPWPDDPNEFAEPRDVVILSAEDDPADTIRPRLDAMGADVSRVHIIQGVRYPDGGRAQFDLCRDLPALEAKIAEVKPLLVIIDPLSAYLGQTDSHKNSDVRGVLAPLAEMAAEHKTAILCILHLNKTYGGKAIYRASGSLAFTAAARMVHLACHDKDDNPDDEADRRKLLLPVKCNIIRRPPGLSYRIGRDLTVQWGAEPVNTTADEAIAEHSRPGPEPNARQEAEAFIVDYLTTNGTVSAKTLDAATKAAGISQATLDRARSRLKKDGRIESFWVGRVFNWRLTETTPAPTPPHKEHDEHEEHE